MRPVGLVQKYESQMGTSRSMMDPRLPKHLIELVDTVCPHKQGSLQQLYHAGFLAAYLASLFERDPYLFKEFKEHITQAKTSTSKRRS
jgi:hypothetical protein